MTVTWSDLRRDSDRWPYRWPLVVLLVGALVTAALTVTSVALNTSNEHRLLDLRAKEVGAALTSALPDIQTPLASATALADATHGNVAQFMRLVHPYVGFGLREPFVSMSLWRAHDPVQGPVAVAGAPPALRPAAPDTVRFFARASASSGLTVIALLSVRQVRLGYAFTGSGRGAYLTYGESALPSDRVVKITSNSAYADLNYALYFGPRARRSELLAASTRRLPLPSPRATVAVPFGDSRLTVVVSPRHPLGGTFPERLPLAIAVLGALLTLGAAALTVSLVTRQRRSERLAGELEKVAVENRRLYAEQRGIALTLQHALLPDVLPKLEGMELSARYEAGVRGIEIGGDWYDVIKLDDRRVLMVVGDVSGRGLAAATSMAGLRFAIHAYATQGDAPAVFLPKLSTLRRLRMGDQIATVLCALIDLRSREISVTSAGHLPPLLISAGGSEFLQSEIGLPVGVDDNVAYTTDTFSAPAGATLLGYTDGLIERRGESLDDGLDRLRRVASEQHGSLDELMTRLVEEVRGAHSEDDTAIAAIRWTR